jgi:hypothetical protein
MEKENNLSGQFGLQSQFWAELSPSEEINSLAEKGYEFLDKNIKYTKRDLTEEIKKKIIAEAQEVIGWKLTTDRHYDNFVFMGFRMEERGLIKVNPMVLFVHDDLIYAWDYQYKAVKFSYRFNYESLSVMFQIIQSENPSLSRSHEIMLYIKDKQEKVEEPS